MTTRPLISLRRDSLQTAPFKPVISTDRPFRRVGFPL
jgi:hypothetical protein